MELNEVYIKFVGASPWWHPNNQTVRSYKLPAFLCPSDREVPTFNTSYDFGARGNYVANAGIGKWNRSLPWSAGGYQPSLTTRGPFLLASYTTIAKITDGMSKTAAVTEIRKSPEDDSRGALFADSGGVQYTHDYLPNATVSDYPERCNGDASTPCISAGMNGSYQLTAKSQHSGGVNLLLMDGAVLFVDDGVDVDAWQAAASPSGGESIALR
jgi:hypothetical protein